MQQLLFIFRRDLRCQDNTGLIEAAATGLPIIPCFIINPEQVGSANSYRGVHSLKFMFQSLIELDKDLRRLGGKLYLFYGKPDEVVEQVIEHERISAVFVNQDYTPYSRHRDKLLEKLCNQKSVSWKSCPDALLIEPEAGVNRTGKPYEIFTPFFRKNFAELLQKPHNISSKPLRGNFQTKPVVGAKDTTFFEQILNTPSELHTSGGRSSALSLIDQLPELQNYDATHNFPALSTSNLSAHNKFGTVSIREVYQAIVEKLGHNHPLIRQLYWRDFFYHIAWFYPHVFGHAFHSKYDGLQWSDDELLFKRWCEGTTGFPLVDAGMRQLNETGFMHNRVRMVAGSFLVKDLHINWLWGEKYFAQQLADYDPAVNNGNWQWVASTGCDHQPYFRIFNPWLQQKRFDPECIYIKRWIPELRSVDARSIHALSKTGNLIAGYPEPIVVHEKEAAKAIALYRAVK